VVRLILLEWIKMRKRAAFWVPLGAFAVLLGLAEAPAYYRHLRQPGIHGGRMPGEWTTLLSNASFLALFVLLSATVILTGSERGWRTQRQHVIDGLSRAEYLGAKTLGALMTTIAFWASVIVLGFGLVLLDANLAADASALIAEPLHFRMMAGLFLILVLISSFGVMFGEISGSAAAGIVVAIFFFLIQLPTVVMMSLSGGVGGALTPYLPISAVSSLRDAAAYDPAAFAASLERDPTQALLPWTHAGALALLYSAGALAAAWLSLRWRDL